jgi:hypothetical protein
MRCVKKIDYRANGEVTFSAMNLLLSQNPKISDSVSQRIRFPGRGKGVHYLIIQTKNDELS